MDFAFTEDQDAVRELVGQIFSDRCSHERSKELEGSDAWLDEDLWKELATANIPGIPIPEAYGGSDFGIIEACVVLEEAGRHCAPVPLLATMCLGAMPIAKYGSEAQCKKWLGAVAEEGAILTAALSEFGGTDLTRPLTRAVRDGDGWRIDGEKTCVPAAGRASAMLVTASTDDDETVVLIVEPESEGVEIESQTSINWEKQGLVRFTGVRVGADAVLGDSRSGRSIVNWMVNCGHLGMTAMLLGVSQDAVRRTAEYLGERKQFGKPIGSFQGVQLRTADAYIDYEVIRGVLWQAAWKLDAGLPAETEIRAARWWGARGGDRVTHSAQHLHGGIGSDADYPIHRYFLWSQQLMTSLGGPQQQLAELGALLVGDETRTPL